MYIVVTGAAGFIGSNIVKALNERGVTRIIAVDNLTRADKFRNLIDCDIADYVDKHDFIARIQAGHYDGEIDAIFHEGACSDTMEAEPGPAAVRCGGRRIHATSWAETMR